jgi:hypothetical protein
MTDTRGERLAAMYAQDDEADSEKREQPEQLRLAGKATLIPHKGSTVALARVEYVETLEALVKQQKMMLEELTARVKKLEHRITRSQNIAERRIIAVESKVKDTLNNRWDF